MLEAAIEAFERETGIRINQLARSRVSGSGSDHGDAVLEVDGQEFVAELKPWAQQSTLAVMVDLVKRHPNGLLVADYVDPKMAERLARFGVEFIDTAGNARIRTPRHHVQIKGNRRPEPRVPGARPKKLRAFTATGLKVTYALLCEPALAAAPYRQIAERAGVALGTVAKAMDDLSGAGFLVEVRGERRLNRAEEVLNTWVDRYPAVLRPKLFLGLFQAERVAWWKSFDLRPLAGYWGGEVAAAHFTQYLQPAVATVYLPRTAFAQLVSEARLRKLGRSPSAPESGRVEVLTPFWPAEAAAEPYVHPILVYADLIATGDVRNRETAHRLYREHIALGLGA